MKSIRSVGRAEISIEAKFLCRSLIHTNTESFLTVFSDVKNQKFNIKYISFNSYKRIIGAVLEQL